MNISRHQFLKSGLYSLVELVCKAAGLSKEPAGDESTQRDEQDFVPAPGCRYLAVACNEHCLAGSCGCFACLERCESGAITAVPGEGIRIDSAACTGCGTCGNVCPVLPKAVRIVAREQ